MRQVLVASARCHPGRVHPVMRGQTNWHWIYAGQDVRLRLKWEQSLREAAPREAMGERLQRAADDLSDEFDDWIDGLGRRYNSLGWWLGQIAEKNPFVSPLFFHICYLKSITDLVQNAPDRNWLVVVENRGLRRALISYAKNSNWKAREMSQLLMEMRAFFHATLCVFNGLRSRTSLVKAWIVLRYTLSKIFGEVGEDAPASQDRRRVFLVHSWLRDDSVNHNGNFVDRFFGVLPDQLKRRGYDIQYFFLPTTIIARQTALTKLLRPLAERGLLFPSHRYLKWVDLLASILLPPLICWLPRRVSRFGPWNITYLLTEERWSQMWSARTSSAYLYYAFAKRLGKAGKSPYRILDTFENHIWEKALHLGIRRYGAADKVIGFQHTTLSWNYHCYSLGSFELQCGALPDTVVCSGAFWADHLQRRGYPSVAVGGALRFEPLPSVSRDIYRIVDVPVILVTSNAGEYLTLEVLRQVHLAFSEDSGKEIWIRFHPHLELRDGSYEQMFDGKLPEHFHFKEEPISELLSDVNLLVYSSTVVCFEALARGIPVLSIVPETFVDLDNLRHLPHLRCAVSTPQELREKADVLLSRSLDEKAEWLSSTRSSMETVFSPFTASTMDAFIDAEDTRGD